MELTGAFSNPQVVLEVRKLRRLYRRLLAIPSAAAARRSVLSPVSVSRCAGDSVDAVQMSPAIEEEQMEQARGAFGKVGCDLELI